MERFDPLGVVVTRYHVALPSDVQEADVEIFDTIEEAEQYRRMNRDRCTQTGHWFKNAWDPLQWKIVPLDGYRAEEHLAVFRVTYECLTPEAVTIRPM